MKRFSLILILIAVSLTFASAHTPTDVTMSNRNSMRMDTLWGAYCYRELNGQISGVSRQKTPFNSFPLHNGEKMVYYVLAEQSRATFSLSIDTEKKAQPVIGIKITEVNTGNTVCEKTLGGKFRQGENMPSIVTNAKLPSKSWYRIELTAKDWLALKSINYFIIANNSPIGIKPSPIFMAPSVHLLGWESTDPNAPKGEAYDWAYMEVMFPKKYERKNTYIMSLGVLSGYMGIQTIDDEGKGNYKHRVLFSMWDKGDTDADANLPDYLRSGALDHEDGVNINRFGGEGTGTQSMIFDSHWRCDNWVQFITTCRPEKLNITIKGSMGQDSTIEYTNTLVSAWYKEAGEKEWHYLSTLREASRNHYMSGWYSFLENFTDDGGEFYRRAYYRNGYLHSLNDGKWYNRNKVGFGHTQGKPHEPRYDYGHGATSLYSNCFYLEHGGYSLNANDSAQTVPLATDNTPVDTINLNALWGRMEQAIRKEQTREMDMLIAQASEQGDKLAAFKALAKTFIDNANKFDYYQSADMADLITVYNNGNTDDAAGLAQELHFLAHTSSPLKQGKAIKTEHIGITRGYQIMTDGNNALVANDNAITRASDNIATDNNRNWRFIRQGNSNNFLVCNIGTKQYLDPSAKTMLSDTPVEVTLSALDKEGLFVITSGDAHIKCRLIDNYFVK